MSFEFEDYAKSIAAIRALSGAQLPLLYTTDAGQEGVWHCVSDVSPDDNTGTLLAGDDLQMTRIYEGAINVKWFGAQVDGTTDDTAAIQAAITAAGVVAPASVLIPQNCKFNLAGLIIPYNVSIKYYGPTNEEITYLNNRKGSSVPVNEFIVSSPYHSAIILDTYDNLPSPASPAPSETSTKRGASFVVRRNGVGAYQNYHSALGRQETLFSYSGIVTITVTGPATSAGTAKIILNGTSYDVPILSGDTAAAIATNISTGVSGSYWIKKEVVGSVVKLYPRRETTLMFSTPPAVDPLTDTFLVTIDDFPYHVDVDNAVKTWEFADRAVKWSAIKANYAAYRTGSNTEFHPLAGGLSISSCSFSNVPAGVTLTSSIAGYSNKYGRISIAQTGNVGIGMWNARSYQMEVANQLRILSNSEENIGGTGSGTNAIFILENENDGHSKTFRLLTNGTMSIFANDKLTQIFNIDDAGNISLVPNVRSGRFTFGATSRHITSIPVSGEDMIHFSNNPGTDYVARISDANGFEQKVGSAFVPLRAPATTSQTGLVKQSAASADTAAPAAGATPTKAEFDALLTELRDLKTKMRTAGMLAP